MTRGILNDLTGKRFGNLLVAGRAASDRQNNAAWSCACDCGNVVVVRGTFLRKGQKYCSHRCLLNAQVKDISGQRFGRLVAVKRIGSGNGGKSVWEFHCDCGSSCEGTSDNAMNGHTKSCGCLGIESRKTIGGRSLTPAYKRECFARYAEGKRRATIRPLDERVLELYERAQTLTKQTGIPHEVDHDLPLHGKYVSGLHVFENMRVVTRHVNRTKSNRFSVDDVC